MKCHCKVHQKYSSIPNYLNHLHKLLAQLFLTPNQFLAIVIKQTMTGSSRSSQVPPIISVACTRLGQSTIRCPINPCQKSLVSHKPMTCDLTAVAHCCSFLWLFCNHFVGLSIGVIAVTQVNVKLLIL